MKTLALIKETTDNDQLDIIYQLLKAIESDLKFNSIEDILDEALFRDDEEIEE